MRIAALASGTGSILDALVAEHLPIAVVVVDRTCNAAVVAERAGIPVERLVRTEFGPSFDRDAYTAELVDILVRHGADLVVMAGFGTVLGKAVHDAFDGRILNTHPALLPAFKGWHAVEEALAAGVKVTGCTVHVATLAVDEGEILAQEAVDVLPDDTVTSLHERIKAVERRIYPEAIRHAIAQLENGERIS